MAITKYLFQELEDIKIQNVLKMKLDRTLTGLKMQQTSYLKKKPHRSLGQRYVTLLSNHDTNATSSYLTTCGVLLRQMRECYLVKPF